MKLNYLQTLTTPELEILKTNLEAKGFINSLIPADKIFDCSLAGVKFEIDFRKGESQKEYILSIEDKLIENEEELIEKDKTLEEITKIIDDYSEEAKLDPDIEWHKAYFKLTKAIQNTIDGQDTKY